MNPLDLCGFYVSDVQILEVLIFLETLGYAAPSKFVWGNLNVPLSFLLGEMMMTRC